MDGWTGNLIVPSDSDSCSTFSLRPSSLDGRAQPNISCNIATFSDVFPEVVREPKPVEWSDGSRELANYCWVIVGVLLVYYLSTSKYVRGYGWAREDDARSKDE